MAIPTSAAASAGIIHTVSGHRKIITARSLQSGYHCFLPSGRIPLPTSSIPSFRATASAVSWLVPGEHNNKDPRLTQSFKRASAGVVAFTGSGDSYCGARKVPICGHIDNGSAFHPQLIRNGLFDYQ